MRVKATIQASYRNSLILRVFRHIVLCKLIQIAVCSIVRFHTAAIDM